MLNRITKELKEGKTFLQFGFLKGLGQGLTMLCPLIIAKFFSEELFASYSLAKLVIFTFTTILIASTQVPFIVFANQEKAKTGKINKTFSIQCLFLVLSFFIFVVTKVSSTKYILNFAQINEVDLLFVSSAFVGIAIKTFICSLFMGLDQRLKSALAELIFGFLGIALVFLLYFLDQINIRTVFAIYPISTLVIIVIFVPLLDFKQLLPLTFDKEYFREIFAFAKWVLFGAIALYFINWGDNFVLRYFVSMKDIGIYNVGYQFFKGIITLTSVIGLYFLPFVSQNIEDADKIRSYLWVKRPKIFAISAIGVLAFFVLLPYMFRFIYGNTYQGTVSLLRVLLIGCLFNLYSCFYNSICLATKRYKYLVIIIVFQAFIKVGFSLIFVSMMGLIGVATATVISFIVKAIILELYFQIKIKQQLKL